jgi:hypothetical protein
MTETKMTIEDLQDMLAASARRQRRSLAGWVLGSRLKKPQRIWTGWVRGQHYWRGRKVIAPEGTVGAVYGSVRSKVIVRVEDPHSILGFADRVYNADDLGVYKLPAAVELGKGKRGVREKKSERKAAAARINGYAPVRPGSRQRGRPKNPLPRARPNRNSRSSE